MSSFGVPITQSVAGLSEAERLAAREQAKKRRDNVKSEVKHSEVVDTVETSEGVTAARNLASTTEEETRQDHKRQPTPQAPKPKPDQPSLDLNA